MGSDLTPDQQSLDHVPGARTTAVACFPSAEVETRHSGLIFGRKVKMFVLVRNVSLVLLILLTTMHN